MKAIQIHWEITRQDGADVDGLEHNALALELVELLEDRGYLVAGTSRLEDEDQGDECSEAPDRRGR